MTLATRRRSRSPASDEAMAGARAVLGITVGVGVMAAAFGAVNGGPLAVIGLPTLVLIGALAGAVMPLAGWSGIVVWATLLPSAHDEALLAPLAMIVLCLAIAVGPDRLLSWMRRDAVGRGVERAGEPRGWIEEDGRPVE